MSKIALTKLSKEISSGLTPLRSNSEFWNEGVIPWVKTEQLGVKNIYDSNEKVSLKAFEQTGLKLYPTNTLSIAMYGEGKTRGSVSILKKEMTTNQACCNVVIDEGKAYYEYVYYFLTTQYEQLRSLSSGIRKNLNSNDIKNFEIRLPKDIPTQKSIAKVLSDLDSKIELNNRINRELEAMAKTLYDYWFVQFDFPNEQGKPYKSSGGKMVYNADLKREIPEGWEVKTLAKITAVSNESVNPMLAPEKEFKHYSIPTYDSSKTYGIEKGIDIRSNKFVVAESDILVSKLNPWFTRVIYPIKEDDLICSTEFVVWRTSNTNIKNYLFMVGKGEHFILHCSQSATGTSNSHKRVNPTVMMRYKVPFNSELIQKFGATINSWIKIGINKQLENQQLAERRDWLLPMLMNGQVTVKEAEESLSMAAEPSVEYKKG